MKNLPDDENGLASHLAGDLHTLVGRFKQRLREQASMGDLPRSQASVLRRLFRDGPATATALARAENMRSQSMGAIVAALQSAGHVIGKPDPEDGRRTILDLTPPCREWISDGRAARRDWLHRSIVAEFSTEEQQQLAAALVLLDRLVASDHQ